MYITYPGQHIYKPKAQVPEFSAILSARLHIFTSSSCSNLYMCLLWFRLPVLSARYIYWVAFRNSCRCPSNIPPLTYTLITPVATLSVKEGYARVSEN